MKNYKTKILCDVTYTFEAASNSDGDYDLFQIDRFKIGEMDIVQKLPEDFLLDLDEAVYTYFKENNNE